VNTARKGSSGELFAAARLEAMGYVVASRRHIGGAGDLLAIHPNPYQEPPLGPSLLAEVKARKNPYEGFRRADRREMLDTPLPPGGVRYLAVVRGSGDNRSLEWIDEKSWPAC